jgi:NADPH:quinone reductase-like Zn-dependent oxidoreductase
MKLRYKISGSILAVLVVAVVAIGLVVSHDSPCGTSPPLPADATPMKAVMSRCYGSPEVIRVETIAKPTARDDELLVKVHAASVNPLDFHYMRGTPYIMRAESGIGAPAEPRLGVDFAGTVEAVGRDVKRFKPGDEVFGARTGAFGEYVTVRESRNVVPKPANVSFEQAAAVPVAALTAIQALRDKGHIRAGQKVLINGASGGVGTFAVQIAKALGAEVTGVCSTRNLQMVKSLGADHVIDYTKEDFTAGTTKYDLIVDNAVTHALLDYRRVLTPEGIFVIVGSPDHGRWLGPMKAPLKAMLVSPFVSQSFVMILAQTNPADLELLGELMAAGKVTPVIDRRYSLSQVPEAIAYLEQGHARGKVIITME